MYESPRPPRAFRIGFRILIAGLLILALGQCVLFVTGYVVVIDRAGVVAEAVVSDGSGREQPLLRLPGGTFMAFPELEGAVKIRCDDGSSLDRGYVTRHMKTWVEVSDDCRSVLERF